MTGWNMGKVHDLGLFPVFFFPWRIKNIELIRSAGMVTEDDKELRIWRVQFAVPTLNWASPAGITRLLLLFPANELCWFLFPLQLREFWGSRVLHFKMYVLTVCSYKAQTWMERKTLQSIIYSVNCFRQPAENSCRGRTNLNHFYEQR